MLPCRVEALSAKMLIHWHQVQLHVMWLLPGLPTPRACSRRQCSLVCNIALIQPSCAAGTASATTSGRG